jgi:hypothetical protein
MAGAIFESAADRIAFSEAVDFIEQGRAHLIPPQLAEQYVRKGLLSRDGERFTVTDEGRQQHQIAQKERFSDG